MAVGNESEEGIGAQSSELQSYDNVSIVDPWLPYIFTISLSGGQSHCDAWEDFVGLHGN